MSGLDLFLLFYGMLILIVCVLVGVAFLTLLERKVLGYIQLRKGPNKVGILGIPQPFSDAIKLFTKEHTYPFMSNYNMYYVSPIFNLFLSLLLWMCVPIFTGFLSFSLGILYFLCCASLSVYTVMLAGWSSNSNYSMLGSMRAVAQTISYEVSLALTLLSFLILIMSLNLLDLKIYQSMIWFIVISLPLCMVWFVSSLAETNRTPFDFAEGESELVSGFNVEYSGGGFALIFLAEYSSILFMSMMCCLLFLGANFFNFMLFFILGFMSFLWVWVRGTLPRYRYDKLMYLAWKSFLPLTLNYFLFFLGLKIFIFMGMI
uniref:NADH-ubiquinone oxidoreductase chain 1 n=2 Tax=Scarabaeoidea TaxID=75546 RepID=S4SVX9_9SCAR|nr:NADH dehydrogenase subunit 1 [Cheironitis sp. MJTNT-2012]ANJ70382.1 NADH dehydrogenase subunit 1 [Dorcus parallelipipedus]UPX88752.1 NADH dehydrogenase subunit 1 [Dorcus parallelipipedus]